MSDDKTSKHGRVTNEGICRSCKATIVWVVTPVGRKMPVDPDTDDSHFATCPQASTWRRGRSED